MENNAYLTGLKERLGRKGFQCPDTFRECCQEYIERPHKYLVSLEQIPSLLFLVRHHARKMASPNQLLLVKEFDQQAEWNLAIDLLLILHNNNQGNIQNIMGGDPMSEEEMMQVVLNMRKNSEEYSDLLKELADQIGVNQHIQLLVGGMQAERTGNTILVNELDALLEDALRESEELPMPREFVERINRFVVEDCFRKIPLH